MNQCTPLSRRRWLQSLAGASLAPWVAGTAHAASPESAWLSAFRPFDAPGFTGELLTNEVTVQGQLPAALRGTLYRNGPTRFQRGQSRLSHWFDGDGMVQALRFDAGRANHRGRFVATPKQAAEAQAGRFLYGGFGSTVADPAPVGNPDVVNAANINLLSTNGGRSLYALWEGGSAIQIDPQTLATLGPKAWSPETAKAPFGAHPRAMPDGTVWNFGYMPGSGKLLVYHIGPDGQLKRQALLDMPQADMVHDFAITGQHLVFLLPPFKYQRPEGGQANLMAGMRWDAQAPMRVGVVRMADLSVAFVTELPHGGVFHLGNAWEEGGLIHLGCAQHPAMHELIDHLRIVASPEPQARVGSRWMEVQINLAQRSARQQDAGLPDVEFPRWDQRHTGQRTPLLTLLQRSAAMDPHVFGFDTVLARVGDAQGGRVQRHAYGDGWIAEEHLHVPHPDKPADTDGWIIGSAYHWPTEKTTVSVFRAGALADGPVAQLRLPYGLPLGLHGQFVAAA